MNEYTNKKVLVTGGGGLIGRQVIHALVDEGADVISVGLDNPEGYSKFITCDLTHKDYCLEVTKDMDYVFHLAGIKTSPDMTNKRPATMSVAPLMMNTNVLEACRINKIPKVLFTSSIGAYPVNVPLVEENAYKGEPMDFLPGMVKRMAEYQIQSYEKEFGLKWVIVRLTNCYGPGDNFNPDNAMFIPSLMAKILRGKVELWGDGSNTRDFSYSGDIAKGVLKMMLAAQDTQPINLGSGEGHTIKEVVSLMQKFIDFEVKFTGGTSGIQSRVLGISKAMKLGYKPETSLYDGLKETWKWFKAHKTEYKRRMNYFDSRGN